MELRTDPVALLGEPLGTDRKWVNVIIFSSMSNTVLTILLCLNMKFNCVGSHSYYCACSNNTYVFCVWTERINCYCG